ncbi:MAG TPA: aminopeptidase P N-terminal domain-containing protein [Rhodanobacteraceae bacterium]|jgi:Xaa-Pro aminopeptidase|nr:aminopeptidase P N-terminal domain-containing protein [Rhodanobacteraceae bacterium]
MIQPAEFARRRRELMRMAGEDAALVVAAAPRRIRNADAEWPYRQDSDFHYLTGFPEPDAVLALLPGRTNGEVVLFCRERDPGRERIDGARIGPDAAAERFGMDDAFPVEDIDDILPGMLEGRARLYCHFGRENEFDAHLLRWLRRLRASRGGGVVPREFVALGHLLHELRLYKSTAELRLMKRAASIAAEAQRAAVAAARPGAAEYEVEAALLHVVRAHGAVPSYAPIVAGGANACVLHYTANRDRLERGDLLLVDAGAEVECYASDITRTWPVGGRFSREQRALYEVVLAAQQAAIEQVREGVAFTAAHDAARQVVVEGLCQLKLLSGRPRSALKSGSYERFFPHKTGHWIGLDVHDVGDYRVDEQPRLLEAGMVVTVEPGIYIPPDDTTVPPKWRGIGIRIEDDVAIGAHGSEVLTAALPKAISEVQALAG